MKQKQTAS
jgi:hypothetical protein